MFDLLNFKSRTDVKNHKINDLIDDPNNFINDYATSKYGLRTITAFNIDKISENVQKITNSLLISMNYINYIMLFNSFYDNFKDLENIEILGFKIPKISILINFIKRMFNYSFINLYSDVFEEIITVLLSKQRLNLLRCLYPYGHKLCIQLCLSLA